MPRIPSEDLFRWSAFIYSSEEAARDPKSPPSASAVIIPTKTSVAGEVVTYAVTNHHVFSAGGHVLVLGAHKSDPVVIPTRPDEWFHAGREDLSIRYLTTTKAQDGEALTRHLGLLHPDERAMEDLNVGMGDEVIAIGSGGRPNNWRPIMRFGNIVSWPPSHMTDGRGSEVELVLVEMRSRGGDSGSPVFIYVGSGSLRDYGAESVVPAGRHAAGFLGIVCGHIPITEKASRAVGDSTEEFLLTTNTNISLVVPSKRIDALIDEAEAERLRSAPF